MNVEEKENEDMRGRGLEQYEDTHVDFLVKIAWFNK